VTYREACNGSIVDHIGRYRELADRDVMARAIATLRARGTYQPSEHVNEGEFPPLTVPELLETLALGEVIARYYRHPCQVDHAVRVGATWEEIAGRHRHDARRRPGRLSRVGGRPAQIRRHE
jgi:hypothetical protein